MQLSDLCAKPLFAPRSKCDLILRNRCLCGKRLPLLRRLQHIPVNVHRAVPQGWIGWTSPASIGDEPRRAARSPSLKRQRLWLFLDRQRWLAWPENTVSARGEISEQIKNMRVDLRVDFPSGHEDLASRAALLSRGLVNHCFAHGGTFLGACFAGGQRDGAVGQNLVRKFARRHRLDSLHQVGRQVGATASTPWKP